MSKMFDHAADTIKKTQPAPAPLPDALICAEVFFSDVNAIGGFSAYAIKGMADKLFVYITTLTRRLAEVEAKNEKESILEREAVLNLAARASAAEARVGDLVAANIENADLCHTIQYERECHANVVEAMKAMATERNEACRYSAALARQITALQEYNNREVERRRWWQARVGELEKVRAAAVCVVPYDFNGDVATTDADMLNLAAALAAVKG